MCDEFLADIFGKHSGSTYEEGLVDSNDEDDFDTEAVKLFGMHVRVIICVTVKCLSLTIFRSTMPKLLGTINYAEMCTDQRWSR